MENEAEDSHGSTGREDLLRVTNILTGTEKAAAAETAARRTFLEAQNQPYRKGLG